jgi:hypothetical protein
MHFHHKLAPFSSIPNAANSKENDRPMMQKEAYPVSPALQQYLQQYKKDKPLPITYKELLHYEYTNAIKDDKGKHTHWEGVVYNKTLLVKLKQKLTLLYTQLTNETDIQIESIDFCEFANSMPFRINITHLKNNLSDLFYIKSADASRIYGFELEQMLTDNRINFLYHQNTLVEEHIDGIPGDDFLTTLEGLHEDEKKLLAAAFITFNESCFARLLGDMRSYNFVVVKKGNNYNPFTIKAIDFDQQCYEGRLNLYWPQFYKENYRYVQSATHILDEITIEDIRKKERQHLASLYIKNNIQLQALLHIMCKETMSDNYKVVSLGKELDGYHHTQHFHLCKTMGELVKEQLQQLLQPYLANGL